MRYDNDGGRGSEVVHPCLLIIQLGIQLLLHKGNSEVSESTFLAFSVFKLLLGFSEVESEVVSPGLLSLQLLLLSVQHLHGLIDGVSEGVKCLNLLLLHLPSLGPGLGEVTITLQLNNTLVLSWRK